MKVAFTTSTGAEVDGNFRKSNNYSIWDISPSEACYVTTVSVKSHGDEDDRILARAEALRECAIVCARNISGPAAAKLVTRNIHPMITGNVVPVEEIINKLQKVLRGNPPPWLRKAGVTDR